MVYLKAIQKSAPMGVSVSGTTNQKTYLKKFRGGFSPLTPPDLGGLREKGGVQSFMKNLQCVCFHGNA